MKVRVFNIDQNGRQTFSHECDKRDCYPNQPHRYDLFTAYLARDGEYHDKIERKLIVSDMS